jgi:hypothetical protein
LHIDHTSASVGRTRLSSCGILHICTVSALGQRDSRWQGPTQSFDLGPPPTVKPWSSRCRKIQDEQSANLSPHDGPTLGMMFWCHVAPIGGPCQAAYLAWFLRTKLQVPNPAPSNPSAFLSTLSTSQHLCPVRRDEAWTVSHDTAPRRPSRVTFLECGVCLTHTHARSLRKPNN